MAHLRRPVTGALPRNVRSAWRRPRRSRPASLAPSSSGSLPLLIESARVDESKVIFQRSPVLESSWTQRPPSEPQTSAVDTGVVRIRLERVDGDVSTRFSAGCSGIRSPRSRRAGLPRWPCRPPRSAKRGPAGPRGRTGRTRRRCRGPRRSRGLPDRPGGPASAVCREPCRPSPCARPAPVRRCSGSVGRRPVCTASSSRYAAGRCSAA